MQEKADNACVPLLVAHRGQLHSRPENTWLALQTALQAGACWVEFDIQMCADSEFILLHDDDFQRTSGTGLSVFECRSTELDALSVHEPERFGDQFAPLPASSLKQVLQRLTAFPQARAMVEIKDESLQHWGLTEVMDRLLTLLEPHGRQCVVIAYNPEALRYVQQHSTLQTGWVLTLYDREQHARARKLQPDFLICNQRKIADGETPWNGPWSWMLYDITEPDRALQWAARNVMLIETGDIVSMLQHPVLATRACRDGL